MPGASFNVGDSPVGYAAVAGEGIETTTGGAGGSSRTIVDLPGLLDWARSRENNVQAETVYLKGRFYSSSTLMVMISRSANISILGLGEEADLENIGLNLISSHNIIIRNLKIHEVFWPGDAINIKASHHVWVDHCELYNKIGDSVAMNTYDGLIDINNNSSNITVSWCYLHDNIKTSLIGHADDPSLEKGDSRMRLTFHHNLFRRTAQRNPSIRYGAIHMFNNYFEDISDYGLASRLGAHAWLENNYYQDAKLAMTTENFKVKNRPHGFICESGTEIRYSGGSDKAKATAEAKAQAKAITQTGCDFWNSASLPYTYHLDMADSVPAAVKHGAGIGLVKGL